MASNKTNVTVTRVYGMSMGAALAITMSWTANNSILWAILHGFFSWGYVIYRAMGYGV